MARKQESAAFTHTCFAIPFGLLMSNPDIGVATVAAEAGHAQPSTTLMIYTQQYKKRRAIYTSSTTSPYLIDISVDDNYDQNNGVMIDENSSASGYDHSATAGTLCISVIVWLNLTLPPIKRW